MTLAETKLGIINARLIDDADLTLDRRQVLTRAIWGTVGLAAAATGATWAQASPAAASDPKSVTYDVACLLNTFTPVVADGATDPFSNFRGTTFFVEGELYPAGTIPDGVTDYNPASDTAIGHWLCRGWFVNRTGRAGEADRLEPHVLTHQEYLIERISAEQPFPVDQLTSSGLEGSAAPLPALRSVVGARAGSRAQPGRSPSTPSARTPPTDRTSASTSSCKGHRSEDDKRRPRRRRSRV